MSNFPFVENKIFRSNLDTAFEHIVDLLTLSESKSYKNKKTLVSSLRKTIIIHTASIVEALLLWKVKSTHKKDSIELPNDWKYGDVKVLYNVVSTGEEIVGATRKKVTKDIDKLDFVRIADICVECKIISDRDLIEDINKVRTLRNRLHIGGLSQLEKKYSQKELEFCFNVARKVKLIVAK